MAPSSLHFAMREAGEFAPRSVAAGRFVFTGTITPHDRESGKLVVSSQGLPSQALAARKRELLYTRIIADRVLAQTWQVIRNLENALNAVGSDLSRLVHLRLFLRDIIDRPMVARAIAAHLGAWLPSGEIVQANGPGCDPQIDITLDAIAVRSEEPAPVAVRRSDLDCLCHPFPPATRSAPLVFTSTVPPLDLVSGQIVKDSVNLDEQSRGVLSANDYLPEASRRLVAQQIMMWRNLEAILVAAGTSLSRMVHHMAWLRVSMRSLGNGSYTRMLDSHLRDYCLTCFPVAGLAREDALLEGRFIALEIDSDVTKDLRGDLNGLSDSYRSMVGAGPLLLSSGEVPIDLQREILVDDPSLVAPSRKLLAFGRCDNVAPILAKTSYIYENIAANLSLHGKSLQDVAHQTIYLADLTHYPAVELAALEYFPNRQLPTTTIVPIVAASPFSEAGIEIEIEAMH